MSETYLSGGRLGEPESPLVHERVLDVEVLGVVENGDRLVGRGSDRGRCVLIGHGVTILCDSRHGGLMFVERRGRGRKKDLKGGGRLESKGGGGEDFLVRKAQESGRVTELL